MINQPIALRFVLCFRTFLACITDTRTTWRWTDMTLTDRSCTCAWRTGPTSARITCTANTRRPGQRESAIYMSVAFDEQCLEVRFEWFRRFLGLFLKNSFRKSRRHHSECCHFVPSSVYQWRHEQGWNAWQSGKIHHVTTVSALRW